MTLMPDPTQPHSYPRRVLALAVGMTPQVLTETVFALAVAAPQPWVPTEVLLLTTDHGAQTARRELLAAGRFARLCADYGLSGRIRFDEGCIRVLRADDGQPLADIRTPQDNLLAADAMMALLRELCADEQAAVHVSIAGGRKTMSYFLGQALTFFGRPQDRLSHVLVNGPFESLPDFFYPPPHPVALEDRDGRRLSTVDAQVQLADIPFVRLRDRLPTALLSGQASFADTIAQANTRLAPPRLVLVAEGGRVRCGDVEMQLPPGLWSWLAVYAEARRDAGDGDGTLSYRDFPVERLLHHYRRVRDPMSDRVEKLEVCLKRDLGVEGDRFNYNNSKLKKALVGAVGEFAVQPYLLRRIGGRMNTRYGLLGLAGESIRIEA